ncbi:MAG: hypothetical protein ACAI44_22970 [Candidatus Sericytochromatia bacterium]
MCTPAPDPSNAPVPIQKSGLAPGQFITQGKPGPDPNPKPVN